MGPIIQPECGYRYSIDACLLADFVSLKAKDRVCDLGTGNGIIPLLLAERFPKNHYVGLELQEELAGFAQKNFSKVKEAEVVVGDVENIKRLFQIGSFDVVTANPPFRPKGTGRVNPNDQKARARHELSGTIEDWVKAAAYLLKRKGRGYWIYRTNRMTDLICILRKYHLEPRRLQMIQHKAEEDSKLFLIEAIKEGGIELTVLPPLIIGGNTKF